MTFPKRAALVPVAALVAVAVLACTGCKKPKPSILIISIDSLRADEVARVENGRPVAPTLAAFERESVRFPNALSAAPWTTPSMMAVMTGLPAPAHGVEEHDRALAPSVPVLAERLQKARWRTGAVSPALTLRPEYGFARGFDDYEFEPLGHDVVTSPKLSGKTLHLLDRYKDDRFLVWVHFWDPHYNYIPPAPYDEQFRIGVEPARQDVQCLKWIENPLPPDGALYLHGQYRGEIAYTDKFVREILEHLQELGRADDTIVVILGDHGESFQGHGWLGHTIRVDQDMTHVPIMIRWPGHLAPAEIGGAVEIAQIGPTLLKLAGLPYEDFGLVKPLPLAPADAVAGLHGPDPDACAWAATPGWSRGSGSTSSTTGPAARRCSISPPTPVKRATSRPGNRRRWPRCGRLFAGVSTRSPPRRSRTRCSRRS